MLLVVSLFTVKNRETREFFVRSLRRGGSWQSTALRVAPQMLNFELFEHLDDGADAPYLCLELWMSVEAYYSACQSPEIQSLFLARRQLADSSFELGAFAYSVNPDTGDTTPPCVN